MSPTASFWLYRNGSGFVLMSLLEGLGLPVIEAIDYGLPCLVSGSSIPAKAGGTAKLQADPQDTASIATAMKSLDMSEDERAAFLGPHTYLPIRTGPIPIRRRVLDDGLIRALSRIERAARINDP